MESKHFEKAIEVLAEKIEALETAIYIKNLEIENLNNENKKLNELLTPKAKAGAENE